MLGGDGGIKGALDIDVRLEEGLEEGLESPLDGGPPEPPRKSCTFG